MRSKRFTVILISRDEEPPLTWGHTTPAAAARRLTSLIVANGRVYNGLPIPKWITRDLLHHLVRIQWWHVEDATTGRRYSLAEFMAKFLPLR